MQLFSDMLPVSKLLLWNVFWNVYISQSRQLIWCHARGAGRHQRAAGPRPPRRYKPQRIQQEWGNRTPISHQLLLPPLSWGALFDTVQTKRSTLNLTPAAGAAAAAATAATPRACESARKEKHGTVLLPVPDSYALWHACKKSWKASSRTQLLNFFAILNSESQGNIKRIPLSGLRTWTQAVWLNITASLVGEFAASVWWWWGFLDLTAIPVQT